MSDPAIFELALAAEVRAARLEAALDADPALAQLWRAEVGLMEAVCSVGLEDVRISAPGILQRIVENRIGDLDTSAAETALAILRFIRSPFVGRADSSSVMERIMRFCPSPEKGEPPWPEHTELAAVFDHCGGRVPILEATRAAGLFGLMTERRAPVAERLVFMAAEQLARGGNPHATGPRFDDPLRGLGGRYDAGWITPPAMSLISTRFRIWSPAGTGHARALVEGAVKQLGREIGRLGTIRSWLSRADHIAKARHGRSRIHDAITAFTIEPLLNVSGLADRIGVTQRGALNLMETLQGQGMVAELTRRRSARYWATPGLAALLVDTNTGPAISQGRRRTSTAEPTATPGEAVASQAPPPVAGRGLRAEAEASMARAMEEFDRALMEADSILARIPERKRVQP